MSMLSATLGKLSRTGVLVTLLFAFYMGGSHAQDAPTVSADTTVGSPGSAVSVPVQVENLESDLGVVQLVVEFDASVLSFKELANAVDGKNFRANVPEAGTLKISFFSANDPISLDGSSGKLFEMRFAFEGGSSRVAFDEGQSKLEDASGAVLGASFEDGRVAENAAPTIEKNAGLTLEQGGRKAITTDQLSASDPNNGPSELTYTVTSLPSEGNLLVSGSALSSGEVFTQQDLEDGNVEYVHTAGDADDDSFEFDVKDPSGAGPTGRTFSISVQLPEPIALTSLRPESGAPGTQVRIYGSGFSPAASENTVTFDGRKSTVEKATSTVLYAQVPTGIEGPVSVSVTSGGETASAAGQFTAVTGGSTSFAGIEANLTEVGEGTSSDWGDYDGDGDLDLVITGDAKSRPTAKIYRNEGNGTFTALGAGLTGVRQGSSAWGDYDGDSDLDLVVTGFNGDTWTAKIYRNEGGGTFTEVGAGLRGVSEGSSSRWGDFDGDGDLDLIITGDTSAGQGSTTLYRNEGGGRFTKVGANFTEVGEGSAEGRTSSEWGDYDKDGDLDLVITGNTGEGPTARIYRNKGRGAFTAIGAGLTGVRGSSSGWGDFDGDSDLDLVVTGADASGAETAKIYRNEGNGTFTAVGAGLTGVRQGSSAWGDYDGDSDLDLVVTGLKVSGSDSSRTAKIYRNEGNGTFAAIGAGLTGVRQGSSAWGDYDGDGDLDLLLAGSESSDSPKTTIYENGGEASAGPRITTFQPESGAPGTQIRIYGSGFAASATGNVVSFGSVEARVDSASSSVIYARVPSVNGGPVEVSVSVEGKQATSAQQFLAVDPDRPSGRLRKEADVTTQKPPRAVATGDWDEDQDQDLAVATADSSSGENANVVIFKNDGSGAFSRFTSTGVSPGPRSLSEGDIDGDGTLDLLVSSNGAFGFESEGTSVLLNDGNGNFAEHDIIDVQGCEFPATLGDWEGDGDLDAAVPAHCSFGISILKNDGAANLSGSDRIDVGYFPASVRGLDLDNDGDQDLAVPDRADSGGSTRVFLYENDGRGQFTEQTIVSAQGNGSHWVSGTDFDRDGDLDMAATWTVGGVSSGGGVSILTNQGGTFAETQVLEGETVRNIATGDYDGDGDPDLAVPQPNSSNLLIYPNGGSGEFSESRSVQVGKDPSTVVNTDVEGDGDLDLAVTRREASRVSILKNRGGGGDVPPIAPVADTTQQAGSEFWVDIKVGSEEAPVKDLFGVSFTLDYDESALSVVKDEAGSFLGSDVVYSANNDASAGEIGIGVSRKSGAGGVDGSGVVARVKFKVAEDAESGKSLSFSLKEVEADDPNDTSITLSPKSLEVTIASGVAVWPGDTNNDGTVDQADVLPLGQHWGATGPARSSETCEWAGHAADVWSPEAATYADANGDGAVDQADVLCIGQNWGKTHPTSSSSALASTSKGSAKTGGSVQIRRVEAPGRAVWYELQAEGTGRLTGASAELSYRPDQATVLKVEPGPAMGSAPLFESSVDEKSGTVALGASRKGASFRAGKTFARVKVRPEARASQSGASRTGMVRVREASAGLASGGIVRLGRAASGAVDKLTLRPPVPNPARSGARVRYALPEAGEAQLLLYNALGQKVKTVAAGQMAAGRHEARIDLSGLASGLYLLRLQAGSATETRKITVVR